MTYDDVRYRSGNCPIFSASKTPPGPGLENSCELPFGCLWTPLSPSTDDSDWAICPCNGAALPPVTCLTCCAYLNIYAELNEEENTWICPLCFGKNVTTPAVLNSAATQVPGIEYRQAVVDHDERDSLTIVLVLDQNLPAAEAQAIGAAVEAVLSDEGADAGRKVQLGLITFGKLLHVYQLGNLTQGLVAADVFSHHEHMADAHLIRGRYVTALQDDGLECLWRSLAAAYEVSRYDATNDEGIKPPSLSRLEQLKRNKEERIRRELGESTQANLPRSPWTKANTGCEKYMAHRGTRNVGEAIQAAIDIATADPYMPARTARILLFTNGCPNFGDGSVVDSSPIAMSTSEIEQSTTTSRRQKRNDAVDAIQLARAIEYFSFTARAASEIGVAMDVFCSGSSELALASYEALVEPTSGYVLPCLAFQSSSLTKNLRFLLCETFVPGLHFRIPNTPGSSLPLADEQWIDGCILDFRMPSFLTMTHMVGPGDLVDETKRTLANESSSFAVCVSLAAAKQITTANLPIEDIVEATSVRIHLGRYDPSSTFSFMLQLNEFFQRERYALFQCIVRYVDRHGHDLVTKVFTRRLAVANDVAEFLDAIDDEVVPVMLGKEAVYRAAFGRAATSSDLLEASDMVKQENLAYDTQHDIDATIQRVSVAYRLLSLQQGTARRGVDLTEEGGVRAAGSSIDFAFPSELSDALKRLYHLRRGPLISPGPMQSLDDRIHLRNLFLRLPLEHCLNIMSPSVWSSGLLRTGATTTKVETVPPDTLALWDNVILVADHFYELFVWSGVSAQAPNYDAVRDHFKAFLSEKSKDRFPAPAMHVLNENDSMSRRFLALLAPSHADPLEQQLVNFPALANLSPKQLTSLQSKVKFHDANADLSFRNWFWSVSSASSQCNDAGISLCD